MDNSQKLKNNTKTNNWGIFMDIGTYSTDYFNRAMVSYLGFGANLPDDAVYAGVEKDKNAKSLGDGKNYTVTF